MAEIAGCRRTLEISVPVQEVESETGRVTADVQKRAKLPGFRPGKATPSLIRRHFAGEIRQRVLENLIPKYLQQQVEAENLKMVGRPDISEVHFHDGEPLTFKAEFEIIPDIELGEYEGVEVPYQDPEVTGEDIDKRLEALRDQKAQYVNLDPRPIQDGDYAVVALESLSGVEGEPIKQDEMVLEIGGADTLPAFTENLRGASPEEEKEFEIAYPEDYGSERLAGKTIRFRATVKGIRKKELPEVNDEFAQDLGDYRNVEELREAIRKSLFAERQREAQEEARNQIVDKLLETHQFPVPDVFVERQLQNRLEQLLHAMNAEGMDLRNTKLDMDKFRETQHDKALREVKASMLLNRIAEREHIAPTRDEVDRQVEQIARQQHEPVAAVRLRFEKDGTLGRIASHIQTEKTLAFLFEHARKTA